jgi:hypothetical protein
MDRLNEDGRDFSIELTSNKHLTRLSANGDVLIEGTLGKLQQACFVEPEILEVKGDCGVLRLNLRKNEIRATNENPASSALEGQI